MGRTLRWKSDLPKGSRFYLLDKQLAMKSVEEAEEVFAEAVGEFLLEELEAALVEEVEEANPLQYYSRQISLELYSEYPVSRFDLSCPGFVK